MNRDFWEPTTSCSSQVAATLFAQWQPGGVLAANFGRDLATASPPPLPSSLPSPGALAHAAVSLAPAGALVLELALGAGLLACCAPCWRRHRPWAERWLIVTAQAFHLMLALPLPPGSFYP
jgi:hypothetical protein